MNTFFKRLFNSLTLFSVVEGVSAPAAGLQVGDPLPPFETVDETGQPWRTSDHLGKKILVIYFYPADMTGGCTKQACAYRDDKSKFDSLGAEVIGISGDTEHNHRLFAKAYHLNFTLLADPKGEIAHRFGVPIKPGETFSATVDGKAEVFAREVTTKRWTFVIDKAGKVAYKNIEVKASEDSQKMLELVKNLGR